MTEVEKHRIWQVGFSTKVSFHGSVTDVGFQVGRQQHF